MLKLWQKEKIGELTMKGFSNKEIARNVNLKIQEVIAFKKRHDSFFRYLEVEGVN